VVGVDIGALTVQVTDVNGDGRQDVVLGDGGATRAVLTAQADGTLAADATASVTAVWNSFLAACAAADRQRAVNHLWGGSSNGYAASFLDTSTDITQLAHGIVATEVDMLAPSLYTITLVYQRTTPTDLASYTVEVMSSSGAWYIQSM
jgi:hypothetical protein